MATPPQLTPEQRAAALVKAAEARAARADIKARLKMGSMSLSEALDSDDPNVGKLKVVAMLESLPGVGKVKARRVMEEIGIAENRRVQGLGAQQRSALRDQLGS
ncbi:MAG: integration host factor, actinobacterial type [Ilumatobacter sp.]|uniref:integration host factor, actinobacterial type n=1 Tax=Ilumatobacter sp. TaxID=1967498 RepID=UPI0026372BC3|nr:integration host factor, actinobacterial type [Ilumatobacter sp.]MDJ0769537.1 integration host factor, actinobacterial type [Ilumatobacter sp.]